MEFCPSYDMTTPFASPSAEYEGSNFSASSQTRVIARLFDFSHPNGCVKGSHGFGLHFPGDSPSLSWATSSSSSAETGSRGSSRVPLSVSLGP